MDEVVNLSATRGHLPKAVIMPDIPARTLHQCEKNPRMLIDMLQMADGDIEEFVKQFHSSDHKARMTILMGSLLILNKPQHAALKMEWDALLSAYKQAKVIVAEREAFNWIGNYHPPTGKNNKVTLSVATAFMRLWLGEHLTSETTKGRRKGALHPEGETEYSASRIYDQLREEE